MGGLYRCCHRCVSVFDNNCQLIKMQKSQKYRTSLICEPRLPSFYIEAAFITACLTHAEHIIKCIISVE